MMVAAALALAFFAADAAPAAQPIADTAQTARLASAPPLQLSAWGLFTAMPDRSVDQHMIAYQPNMQLFSDYAEKQRYMRLPDGATAVQSDALPQGTVLVKSFGYQQNGSFRPIETRLLVQGSTGWVPLTYVWRADLSDADLRQGGLRVPIRFTDPTGVQRDISYAVPNRNQCKECHGLNGAVEPLGIRASNITYQVPERLRSMRPYRAQLAERPRNPWPRLDDMRADTGLKARAYLQVNCGGCHREGGSASNSGLWFTPQWVDRPDSVPAAQWGLLKRPVAAGRGSGGRAFVVKPGDPDGSILLYRMASTEPGVAMPEVGRHLAHDEGLALIRQWIADMPNDNQGKAR